jgi:hypothetical protein
LAEFLKHFTINKYSVAASQSTLFAMAIIPLPSEVQFIENNPASLQSARSSHAPYE